MIAFLETQCVDGLAIRSSGAFAVITAPFGFVIVQVTLAPTTGDPFAITVEVMETGWLVE